MTLFDPDDGLWWCKYVPQKRCSHPGCDPKMRQAKARRTDPGTSWAAAKSVTETQMRLSQQAVLTLFREYGPMTDEELVRQYDLRLGRFPMQSPSGLRTRRKELTEIDKIRDTGRKAQLKSGRWAIVWEAVP